MKRTLRYLCLALASLLLVFSLSGCAVLDRFLEMPETEVTFYDLNITLPPAFIRDSTQSDDYLWVYEKGFYAQTILLSIKTLDGDVDQVLDGYVAYIQEHGDTSQRTTFLEQQAVRSTFIAADGAQAQEMLFVYNGYCYAISLRGGTEQEFNDLLATAFLTKAVAEM